MTDKLNSTEAAELRCRAEKRLRSRQTAVGGPKSEVETGRLVHELQVHQIELEMQNEELREAQQRLEESRDHYAAFYDFAPVGYVTFDAKGVIREINLTAAAMLSVPRAKLIGQPFHPFVAVEQLAQFLPHLRKRAELEQRVGTEFSLVRKDQPALPVVMQSVPACGGKKQGHHCRATLTDLTARKQAEEALSESRQRLEGIVGSAMDALISVDAGQRIVLFNEAAEKMFRCTAREAIGGSIERFIPMRFHAAHAGHIRRFGETGVTNRTMGHMGAISGVRAGGEEFPIEASISQIEVGSKKLFTVILRDITERRRLEREVLETMEHEQRRIGLDLHDGLGQQLTATGLVCHALRHDLAGHPKLEKQAAKLGDFLNSAVRQTRALSHGLAPLLLAGTSLVQALDELARTASTASHVKCRLHCPLRLEIADAAVASQFYRIAQEAVNNALKHGSSGKIEIKLSCRNNALRVRISDDGRGFPEPREPQAGVGLRVMKYRADLIGGTLLVESKPGHGVTVECTVPLKES